MEGGGVLETAVLNDAELAGDLERFEVEDLVVVAWAFHEGREGLRGRTGGRGDVLLTPLLRRYER